MNTCMHVLHFLHLYVFRADSRNVIERDDRVVARPLARYWDDWWKKDQDQEWSKKDQDPKWKTKKDQEPTKWKSEWNDWDEDWGEDWGEEEWASEWDDYIKIKDRLVKVFGALNSSIPSGSHGSCQLH